MVRFSIMSVIAFVLSISPAKAGYTLELSEPFRIFGTETTEVYRTGCGPIGLCSSSTVPFENFYTGPLEGTYNQLDGLIVLSGFNPIYRWGGTANLLFRDGSLVSSSFFGNSSYFIFNCPTDCVAKSIEFTGTPLKFVATNTITGQRSFITAVPEPSSWVLMLGGFGVAGLFMRLNRRVRRCRQLLA